MFCALEPRILFCALGGLGIVGFSRPSGAHGSLRLETFAPLLPAWHSQLPHGAQHDPKTIKNIKFIQHDKNFKPLNLIKSDTAVAEKNNWILSKPSTKTINDNILTTPSEKISISKGLQGIKTVLDPKYLSLSDLSLLIKTSNEGFRKRSLSLEYWKKILQPFITFSLLLLSLSFIFGPMRDQKSSQRIIVSLVVAFCFDLSNKLLGSISIVTGTSVFLAVLLPALVVSVFGLISLRRLK